MSTVNAYSAWVNGKGTVSVLCGIESDSLSAMSMGLTAKLTRTCIHTFSMELFLQNFPVKAEDMEATDSKNPFRFEDNGLSPINLEQIFKRPVKIQILETSDFSEAVKFGIINEKDASGNYLVRDNAYKLDRVTKQRVIDSNGNFVYRRCSLRPDTKDYADITVSVAPRTAVDINDLGEAIPQFEEETSSDDVPF